MSNSTLVNFCVVFSDLYFHFTGEVEDAEERSERAKSCPCPVHAKRHRKLHKDRSRVKMMDCKT